MAKEERKESDPAPVKKEVAPKIKEQVKAAAKTCDELFKVGDEVEVSGQKFSVKEVRGLDVLLEGKGLK